MHLLIDGQALQTPSSRLRGIGRYSSNLLRALAAARPHWRIEVVQNNTLPPIAREDLAGRPILSFHPPAPAAIRHQELNERYYADWLTARGADGVLVLSHCEGWEAIVPSFCGPRPRVYGIAYDLIPLLYPERYLKDFGVSRWYAHRFRHLLKSDILFAISEATARDVRFLGAEQTPQVVNIAGAVDPLFAPLSPDELASCAARVRQCFGLKREFLLYVGAADYRKNLEGAIRAFGALPADCRSPFDLAVVCRLKPAERAAFESIAHEAGVASSLKLICSATDEDLRGLYQMCRLFFFPSLYEGLGLPVLEALHCGAPVVTSNCSSLPEYAGPVSWLGDPSLPEEMARVLQEALAEPRDARREERCEFARTFSWQKTAERACTIMERGARRRIRGRRRRLAWVSPLTPVARGMIEYATDLLPFLSEHFEIELVVSDAQQMPVPEPLSNNYLVLTEQEIAARHAAAPYDMFLYQMSSARPHLYMLDLMRQFPGLVVLHDPSPTDLNRLAEINLLWPRDALHEANDPRVHAPGQGLMIHSAWAWLHASRLLNTPVLRLPMPCAIPPLQSQAAERAALDLPSDAILLCTLVESPFANRLRALLGVLAELPAQWRDCVLAVLVSEGDEPETPWIRLADELGVMNPLIWRTRVPRREFVRYARAADVCIQLRHPEGGETTPLLLGMAAGTACIASASGPASEMPNEVVWKVRTPYHEQEDLALALQTLLEQPEDRRRRGEAAAQYVARQHDPRRVAAAYASWIDLAITRHQEEDGLWKGYALQCLADYEQGAEKVIGSWAALRAQGQQQFADVTARDPAKTPSSFAA
jgi:glycosyltransferase involved in cell wall biosynthesis